jgi:hypothetical protein
MTKYDNNTIAVRYINEIQAISELIISNRHMFVNDDSITTKDIPYEWTDMLTSFNQIRDYLKSAPAVLQNLGVEMGSNLYRLTENAGILPLGIYK